MGYFKITKWIEESWAPPDFSEFYLVFSETINKGIRNEGGLVQCVSESSFRKTETTLAISTESISHTKNEMLESSPGKTKTNEVRQR